jgi:hypothetical protein
MTFLITNLFLCGRPEVTCNLDWSTLKRVCRRTLTAESWVKSRVSLRVPSGRQHGTWADCPISIIPPRDPYYYSSCYCYKKDKRASPGNLQTKRWSSGRSVGRNHKASRLSNCSGPFSCVELHSATDRLLRSPKQQLRCLRNYNNEEMQVVIRRWLRIE